jgi:hypothetical protein
MPTLRRILKYTPALVLGLLVAAWLATLSGNGMLKILYPGGRASVDVLLEDAHLAVFWSQPPEGDAISWNSSGRPLTVRRVLGPPFMLNPNGVISFPLALLCIALLPVAIGSFTGFRFHTWQGFAYAALVALATMYYLWW